MSKATNRVSSSYLLRARSVQIKSWMRVGSRFEQWFIFITAMDPERLQISEDVAKTCRHFSAIPKVNRLTQTSTAQGQVIDSRDRHGRSMLTAHSSTQSFSAMRRQLADFAGKPAILKVRVHPLILGGLFWSPFLTQFLCGSAHRHWEHTRWRSHRCKNLRSSYM